MFFSPLIDEEFRSLKEGSIQELSIFDSDQETLRQYLTLLFDSIKNDQDLSSFFNQRLQGFPYERSQQSMAYIYHIMILSYLK